ncbi:MAG: dimethyl sulfoxide reductase anchor subunit [Chloroflexi bacterium]|nr:dimethyl sulfoxide reductase anchor subunit [Chloroflexota bacterium]
MNQREWALPVYTILLQLATGSLLALWVIRAIGAKVGSEEMDRMVSRLTAVIWGTLVVAMVGAHLHLSRPWLSFLALRNIGSSWLSREIFFTVLFFLALSALAALQWFVRGYPKLQTILGWAAITCGLVSIFCMSVLYLMPTQPAWDSAFTIISFFATTVLLGAVSVPTMLVLELRFSELRQPDAQNVRPAMIRPALGWFAAIAFVLMLVLLILNLAQILLLQSGNELARLSLQLLLGLYRPLFVVRLVLLLVGVGWLVFTVQFFRQRVKKITELMLPVYMACLLVLVSEILGRFLFYAMHIRLGL